MLMAVDQRRADDSLGTCDDGGACHIGIAADISDFGPFDDDTATEPSLIMAEHIATEHNFLAISAQFAGIAARYFKRATVLDSRLRSVRHTCAIQTDFAGSAGAQFPSSVGSTGCKHPILACF